MSKFFSKAQEKLKSLGEKLEQTIDNTIGYDERAAAAAAAHTATVSTLRC
jgi:hypothetical protein